MGTERQAIIIMDYRYDEGCRVRRELLCPTIARLSDRGGSCRQAFSGGNMEEKRIRIKQATRLGYIYIGGLADLSYPNSKTRRGRVQDDGRICPTITRQSEVYRMESETRIRKLTPRECFKLMGFTDEDFDKAAAVNSDTQLYAQAGNSIVVNVLEAIFKQLF